MNIQFYKMTGSGNDFIIIDNRDGKMNGINLKEFIPKICARCVSVGADGLILIENSDKVDFKWQFFNADGSSAEMCGNGSRCAARFAYLNGIAGKKMKFETIAGIIEAEIMDDFNVKVQLTEPFDEKIDYEIDVLGERLTVSSINTGVPHVVVEVKDDIYSFDVVKYGREIRFHEVYKPAGTNVNFFKKIGDNKLKVRTYERGVENETMACGTGSVATSIIAVKKGIVNSPVEIETSSGLILKVYLEDGKVFLEGEARVVYTGNLNKEALEY
ncbi:diaminopimelate epimerase [Deferribacter thermophilus]|uniref:diaminopimelate epimerase n=1 Tax=Deferribacter thermophilus TaxID=53573 RepID=UPI003C2A2FCD